MSDHVVRLLRSRRATRSASKRAAALDMTRVADGRADRSEPDA